MGYDSFTITALLHLEDLGFCHKGEGGPFAAEGTLGPGGGPLAMNTNGGGLSFTHPGMYGMFLITEAVRQLRGECGERQVEGRRRGRGARIGHPPVGHVDRGARHRGDVVTAASGDTTPSRFEPPIGAESGPFWEATREGRLFVQWCTSCDRGVFYPRAFCPHCAAPGSALEWSAASGRATVYAAVVEHNPEAARVAFSGGEPYCVALVDLEEGVRMMTNVIGCPPDGGPQRHGRHRHLGAPERRPSAAPLPPRHRRGGMSVPEDKLAAAAQGMLLAWWAERIPDRLALVTLAVTAPTRT